MDRRDFLNAIGATTASAMLQGTPVAGSAASRKPNFVILFADDQGYADVGCYGSETIRTPRLDRMAREGMRFTSFYAQPICGPSRAALMTGCYPMRVAERGNLKNTHPVLHSEEITIAELLKPLGYTSAMIGKWDLATHSNTRYQPDLLPEHQGFDLHFGTPTSNDNWKGTILLRNGEVIEKPISQRVTTTKRYTDEAIRFMRQNRDRPFFVYLAYNMPHTALHVSPEFRGQSAGGIYGDVIEELDFNVGRVLDTLDELGLAGDTYVTFTSDNGPWLLKKAHGGSAGPLRSGKVSTWEGGVRVPCIMRAPGHIPAGKVCEDPATTMDMLPTFAGLAGAAVPDDRVIDGEDITHLLSGRFDLANPDKTYYYYLKTHLQAVRREHWKLHLPRPPHPPWLGSFARNTHIDPKDDIGMAEPMLFDLEADIGERRDVAKKNPEVVARLLKVAEAARADVGDYNRIGKGARFFDPGPKRKESAKWINAKEL